LRLIFIAMVSCFIYPAAAQIQHGSVGVIYFTKEKIAVAADSRGIMTRRDGTVAPPDDSICKIAAVGGDVIFISTGIERAVGDPPLVPGWDNVSEARSAYAIVKAKYPNVKGRVGDIANLWKIAITKHFNTMARLSPTAFRAITLSPGALTVASFGGFDLAGNLVLIQIMVTADASRTAAGGFTEAGGYLPASQFLRDGSPGYCGGICRFVEPKS
jgi:hypothetical protein